MAYFFLLLNTLTPSCTITLDLYKKTLDNKFLLTGALFDVTYHQRKLAQERHIEFFLSYVHIFLQSKAKSQSIFRYFLNLDVQNFGDSLRMSHCN